MKFWFDTEFIEDGRTVELISLGMVSEDGTHLYLENSECDLERANPWVEQNVIPKLDRIRDPSLPTIVTKAEMRDQVRTFVRASRLDPTPEFWAYYASYDWMVMCQLFGKMIDLPHNWPMHCMDFKQMLVMLGNPFVRKLSDTDAHNALDDALWLKRAWYEVVERHNGSVLQY